jgi:hypothetical protein
MTSRVMRLAAAVALAFGAACGGGGATPTLSDLNGVEALKTQFNRDAGKPRIVLLLSPT